MSSGTRSPLHDDPLQLPRQSADEQIRDLIHNRITERLVFVVVLFGLALTEWYRWMFGTSVQPYPATVAFAVAIAVLIPQVISARRRIRNLRLGRDGERAVGRMLERLRRDGYHVFHDIVGPDWNVNHVVIGPGGVFTIETRTHCKPKKGPATIICNDAGLHLDGFDLSDCLVQARAQARFLNYLLGEETGTSYPIQPVVLFPGWFIDADGSGPRDVWVLEPKAFLKWVRARREILSRDQVRTARRALSGRSRHSYAAGITTRAGSGP